MSGEDQTEDEVLIGKYLAGDSGAFDELYARYRKPLYAYLNRLLQDPSAADDVFQQTWIRAVNGFSRYESRKKFFSWLSMIAHNLAIDHFRKMEFSAELPLEEGADLPDTAANAGEPWRDMHNSELKSAIDNAVKLLPDDLREVFLLRQQGISFREIAQVQKCTVNTVLGRMRYALLNLRKKLSDWNT